MPMTLPCSTSINGYNSSERAWRCYTIGKNDHEELDSSLPYSTR